MGLGIWSMHYVAFVAMWLAVHLREVSASAWSKLSSACSRVRQFRRCTAGMAAARLTPLDTSTPFVRPPNDDAVMRHGIVVDKVSFVHKRFTPEVLERRVREVVGGA